MLQNMLLIEKSKKKTKLAYYAELPLAFQCVR